MGGKRTPLTCSFRDKINGLDVSVPVSRLADKNGINDFKLMEVDQARWGFSASDRHFPFATGSAPMTIFFFRSMQVCTKQELFE